MIVFNYQNKKMNFLDIEINEKNVKKIILILAILVFLYVVFTMISYLIFEPYKMDKNTSLELNNDVVITHIDLLAHDSKKIEITGWAYKDGQKIEKVNSSFVLKNKETGKMYLMKNKMEKVESLKDIGCELGGLHAQCLLLGMKKGTYDIYVLYQNDSENILSYSLITVDI